MKISKDGIASKLPPKLYEKLMPFQKDGVEFAVRKNGRCLIADEMGLGKTLQAISVAYYYRREWPLLIIVPSSLRYSWIEEFEKWLPDVNPAAINLIQTGSDASGIADASVTITTFGLLSKSSSNIVREALLSQEFQVVIVDESHYIRNVKTASAKIVVPLIKNANRRILLSGTPALARPVELFPQIDAICPNGFGTWWSYTSKYCDAKLEWIGKIKKRNVNGASNLEELQQKLSSTLMIRRQKSEVLTQLPPKQRQRVLFELKDSDIKKEIRKTFEELRPLLKHGKTKSEALEVLTGAATDPDVKDLNSLSLIQKLYQLSGEAKIGPAKEYVEMLCDNPNLKFLVFAYHHSMMNGLCQSLYDKKVRFIRIDGDTPPSERPQLVHQFQSDPNTRVAILSILAAGVGLTFTAATVVVFAEMYWTPGMMIQCEDRAHRIGQSSCVAVHYLVAKDTMDEWVWSAVCKKTIVTSTTLTGKKQKMEADAGDKYQIDVLSNAEAWVPKENENLDLSVYFSSQQSTDQKSILEFFSPCKRSLGSFSQQSTLGSVEGSQEDSVNHSYSSPSPKHANKRQRLDKDTDKTRLSEVSPIVPQKSGLGKKAVREKDNSSVFGASNEKKQDNRPSSKKIIVIESESDGEDFDTRDSKKKKSTSRRKSLEKSKKDKKKLENNAKNLRCNLKVLFSKSVKNQCQSSVDPCVISDSDSNLSFNENVNKTVPSEQTLCPTAFERSDNNGEKEDNYDCDTKIAVSDRLENFDSSKTSAKSVIETQTDSKQNKVSLAHWNCGLCTFLNHKDLIYCEMCETPKKTKNNDKDIKQSKLNGKIQTETEKMVAKDEIIKRDKRISTVMRSEPEVTSDISMSSLKDNMELRTSFENGVSTGTKVFLKKKYTNSFHDVSDVDETSENQIEDFNSNSENAESGIPELSVTKSASHTLKSEAEGLSLINRCDIKENDTEQKSMAKNDSDCRSPKFINTAENVRTPKQYRFKSVNRMSVGKSPLTPPVIPSKNPRENDISILKEIGPSDDIINPHTTTRNNSDLEIAGNNSDKILPIQNGSCLNTDKKRVSAVCDKANEVEDGSGSGEEKNVLSWPDMEELNKISDRSEVLQEDQESKEMVKRQLDSGAAASTDKAETRIVNIDGIQVHTRFRFQCSKYTGRVYVLTEDDKALNVNFIPTDIDIGNHDDLPDLLLHPSNLRLVQKFVREWQSLSETKKRLIIKHGRTFVSPLREYDELKSCKTVNTQRHRTKEDTALAAMLKAAEVDGSVRVISKKTSQGHSEDDEDKGVTQAVGPDGVPLCLNCFQPYKNSLVQRCSVVKEENAWNTRFCSLRCSQEYWMKTNNEYCRDKVYEAEHGICQICGFDTHSLFKQVRDTHDLEKRAEVIAKSKLNTLNSKTKQQMVKKPVAGQFWHVDHILPVWEGGGQCDIDNLRTLCIPCHQTVTAKQARKRAIVRRLGDGAGSRDITAFFQKN